MFRKCFAFMLSYTLILTPVVYDCSVRAESIEPERFTDECDLDEDPVSMWFDQYICSIHPTNLPGVSGGTCMFTYDEDHQRISKKYGDSITEYTYDEKGRLDQIIVDDGTVLSIGYDSEESLIVSSIDYFGETFHLNYDFEGNVESLTWKENVIAVYDYSSSYEGDVNYYLESGTNVSPAALTIGYINPFRYRGMIYDRETGDYYTGVFYYDPENDTYLHQDFTNDDSGNQNRSYYDVVIANINSETSALMNSVVAGYCSPKTYSSGWYSSLSTVEIVARLIYGESGSENDDKKAVAWVMLNRYDANSTDFHTGSNNIRNIATFSGAFSAITGGANDTVAGRCAGSFEIVGNQANFNKLGTCTWNASAVCNLVNYPNNASTGVNWSSVITKPYGISTQKYFLSVSTFCNVTYQGTGYICYNYNNHTLKLLNVCIPGNLANVTNLSTITNNSSQYQNRYNVYYNYQIIS